MEYPIISVNLVGKEKIMKKNSEPRIISTIRSNPCLRGLFINSEEKILSIRSQPLAQEVKEIKVKRVNERRDTRETIIWPDGKLSRLHM